MAKTKDAAPTAPEPPAPAGAELPPAGDAAPPVVPPAATDQADVIADLKQQVAELTRLVHNRTSPAADAIPTDKSMEEQRQLIAEIEKGVQVRTQEAADRQFPGGKFRFRCVLADGNGHPELVIGADGEVDAAARYMAVCGIRSSDKQAQVARA